MPMVVISAVNMHGPCVGRCWHTEADGSQVQEEHWKWLRTCSGHLASMSTSNDLPVEHDTVLWKTA